MNGKNQNNDKDYIIDELSKQISELKNDFPDSEMALLVKDIKDIRDKQNDIKDDISEIKKIILDPDNGIVVKVNKNTDYREMLEAQEDDNLEILEQHQSLVKFKENVTKLLWLITGAIISIITKIFFFGK